MLGLKLNQVSKTGPSCLRAKTLKVCFTLSGPGGPHELPHHGAVRGCARWGHGRRYAALSKNEYLLGSRQSLVLGQTSLCHARDPTGDTSGSEGLSPTKPKSSHRSCGPGSVYIHDHRIWHSHQSLSLPRSWYKRFPFAGITYTPILPTCWAIVLCHERQSRAAQVRKVKVQY